MSDFLRFCNLVLKMTTFSVFSYYTTWGLILFVLYALGILKEYQSSIFVVLLNTFFGGMLITYVYPREIVIPYIKRKISDTILKLYNFVFHVLPLLVFVYMYDTKIKQDNLYLAVISLLLYVFMFNPLEVYNYRKYGKDKIIANILVISYFILLGILIINQKKLF
tara:strand:- start:820 stop:1314 length:495 start_codon:yes stop_codon:yes gene_type:complete